MNFMSYTVIDAAGDVLRVWNVLLYFHKVAQVQYLAEADIFIFHTCLKISSCLQRCKNYKKSIEILQSHNHIRTATFLMVTRYVVLANEDAQKDIGLDEMLSFI